MQDKKISAKLPTRKIFIGTAIPLLLIGGGAVSYWLFNQPAKNAINIPSGINLLPEETLFSLSLSTDNNQWQKLDKFGTPESRYWLKEKINKFNQDFLINHGYDYQRDIQPWVGPEIIFAQLSSAAKISKNDLANVPVQQPIVILLPIKDLIAAKQTLEKPKSAQTEKLIERDYQGFKIKESTNKSSTLAMTVINNIAIVSNTNQAIEKIIDSNRTGKNIMKIPGYQQALTKINTPQPFARIFLNIPNTTATIAANSPRSLAPNRLAQIQEQQGMITNITLEDNALNFTGLSWWNPNSKYKLKTANNNNSIAKLLPENTMMMVSTSDFSQLWQDFNNGSQNNPIAPLKPEIIQEQFQNITGLNWQNDLLKWSKSELAIAILPKPKDNNSELSAGLTLLIKSTDKNATNQTWEKLDRHMESKYKFKTNKANINGQEIINWVSPLGGTSASHGWLNNDIKFLTLGAPVATTFIPSPPKNLENNPQYQAVITNNLNPNNGQFFINLEQTINPQNLLLPRLPEPYSHILKSIKTIGLNTAAIDPKTNRFDLKIIPQQIAGNFTPKSIPSPQSTSK